jgi:hypothetical protein
MRTVAVRMYEATPDNRVTGNLQSTWTATALSEPTSIDLPISAQRNGYPKRRFGLGIVTGSQKC